MSTKSIVYKLVIDLESTTQIVGSSKSTDTRTIVNDFNAKLEDRIHSIGFVTESSIPRAISELNGGYAVYDRFAIDCNIIRAKLLIDVRCGDHPSKPNLKVKTERRLSRDVKDYADYDSEDINIQDSYLEVADNNTILYYIGKGESYGKPLTDEQSALNVITLRIKKFLSSRFSEYANRLLNGYPKELVSLAEEYVKDIQDVEIVEDTSTTLNIIDNVSSYEKDTRDFYILLGMESDILDDSEDLDKLAEIILVRDLY